MNTDNRPNPEELLQAIQLEESKKKKGRLKIFLGMAAGVGKTYSMLEEAQSLKKDGIDVVIGSIDTHGRRETAFLLEGLKIIPEKWIKYKDTVFEEMDLDEILKLRPQVVLVDELAHSNVPGSRHPKRWQDVNEILENGIDVYTTLNVQHIESLKDLIENIAGIPIRETIPDMVVESATFIEVVDITPGGLLQRLNQGKIYLEDQSKVAIENFFQEDRLTALREVVLRYAAEKVDHDLHGMVSTVGRVGGWKSRERLLVAVSHSPHSQRLIRMTRRLAFNLDAPWIAVHVNDGCVLDENETALLSANISLARDLGAEVITTMDTDIADGIERISHQKGVTQIIIGRSPPKTLFSVFRSPSLLDRLAKDTVNIDVHVVSQDTPSVYKKKQFEQIKQDQFYPYLFVILSVLMLTGINWLTLPFIGYRVAGFIFLLGILFLSLFVKRGPIFFASLLYALIWGLYFIPSMHILTFGSREDVALIILYPLTAIMTGILVDRERKQKEILQKRGETIGALYEIVRNIANAPSPEQLIKSIKERLQILLKGTCEILIKRIDNGLIFDENSELVKDEKEKNAVIWVYENGKEAGWSTSTLPMTTHFFIPLKGFKEIVGVFAFKPNASAKRFSLEETNFIYTVCQQLANYLERSFSEERTRRIEYLNQIEKTYQSIMFLISKEFKKPLVTIQEAIKELKVNELNTHFEVKQIHKIEHSSKELSQVLVNISVMEKLATGSMPINREMKSIYELIETFCEKTKELIQNHKLTLNLQANIPLIFCDPSLIELLLYNLLFNAIEYSPIDSTIEIEAIADKEHFILSVLDEGKGIPQDKIKKIFEKFYRLPGAPSPGLGLGLSIAESIAELHEGVLKAENRKPKGAKFSLFLSLKVRACP